MFKRKGQNIAEYSILIASRSALKFLCDILVAHLGHFFVHLVVSSSMLGVLVKNVF